MSFVKHFYASVYSPVLTEVLLARQYLVILYTVMLVGISEVREASRCEQLGSLGLVKTRVQTLLKCPYVGCLGGSVG